MTHDFGLVITAMVTPYHDDLTINYSQAKKLACQLVNSGSDGLVVAGTTGESPVLSKEEKIELFKTIVDQVGGKAAVIAGTGSNSTADSILLTQAAQKAGADGVLLVAPYYNKPTQEGLYQHFKAIAESTDLPVMLYNIPGRTSVNILPETVVRLAQISNIVAIKESSGSMDQVSELKRNLPEHFSIYSGDDSLTLPILSLGGKGVVSVVSHLVGSRLKEMINAYTSGNTTLATNIHLELLPVFKGMFITTNPAPIKTALNLKGLHVGRLRLPMVEVTEQERERIKALMEKMKLL